MKAKEYEEMWKKGKFEKNKLHITKRGNFMADIVKSKNFIPGHKYNIETLLITKEDIENYILDKTFEFTIEPRNKEIEIKNFVGKVLKFDITIDLVPVTLFVELRNDAKITEVSLINLVEIKYVC